MESHELWALGGFALANFVVATSGAIFSPGDWYKSLAKPSWTPPDWLFGPAWTVLYITIAVAGWLVWRETGLTGAPVAFAIYGVQLVLNSLWSAVFFGMKRPDLAMIEVSFLWLSILATILAFWPLHAGAALLLLPYLAWVSFAAALNFALWRMNAPRSARA